MAEMRKVVIDAGHGGAEPGAVYQGRREKNDTLRLALAVGQILSENGVDKNFTFEVEVALLKEQTEAKTAKEIFG